MITLFSSDRDLSEYCVDITFCSMIFLMMGVETRKKVSQFQTGAFFLDTGGLLHQQFVNENN